MKQPTKITKDFSSKSFVIFSAVLIPVILLLRAQNSDNKI